MLLSHHANADLPYSHVMTVDTFMCIEHAHSDDHVICAALLARHGERAMVSEEDGHEEL